MSARFTKVNTPFSCANCGMSVPESKSTCRNHCPKCLHSKHVDVFPGDRMNPCQGLLKPIGYENHKKKGLMIWFQCQKCGDKNRNIASVNDPIQSDDYDAILQLSGKC